jgi:hypothetical protein
VLEGPYLQGVVYFHYGTSANDRKGPSAALFRQGFNGGFGEATPQLCAGSTSWVDKCE